MSGLVDGFEAVRALLAVMEENVAAGTMSSDEAHARLAVIYEAITSPLSEKARKGQPPRGLGYGQKGRDGYLTPDEAMIVASLPWFGENLSDAIRAQLPKASPEEVRNHADRIRERQTEIEEKSGDQPWQTSSNWLGDLIED